MTFVREVGTAPKHIRIVERFNPAPLGARRDWAAPAEIPSPCQTGAVF
jgi:hypothetical protein